MLFGYLEEHFGALGGSWVAFGDVWDPLGHPWATPEGGNRGGEG